MVEAQVSGRHFIVNIRRKLRPSRKQLTIFVPKDKI